MKLNSYKLSESKILATSATVNAVLKLPIRAGMQLLELIVSLASASVLLAGMTSAVLIANRSADLARTRQATSTRNIAGFDRLRSDLSEASPVTNRTARSVTLSVNDRDEDGGRETIQYQWLGAGNPLQMSINSAAWQGITDNLDAFQFAWRNCAPQSNELGPSQLEPTASLIFQSRTIAHTSFSGAKALSVEVPPTYQANDLLVAALAVTGNQNGSMLGPSGWTKVFERNNGSDVSLGVWVAFSNTLAQADFTWDSTKTAYGTIAHFRKTSATAALTSFLDFTGSGALASAPASSATVDNALAIRILAATGPLVGEEATNMPGHIAVTLRRQLLANPIIGMAYRNYTVGAVPSANFGLPSSATYVAATLVFQP